MKEVINKDERVLKTYKILKENFFKNLLNKDKENLQN